MIIEINDALTVGEISDVFSSGFPYLSIALFKDPHAWGKASSFKEKLPADKAIAEIRKVNTPGALEIHGWHQTRTVEQEFGKIFGLYVQVLRKEGAAWIQTADTDPRTLEEQNEAGRNASQELLDGTDKRFNNENPA
ncbi:MAG: hypothetical protein ABJB86_02225 [Bacteroidota bacterium]